MLARRYILDTIFDAVSTQMQLRVPQCRSLQVVHEAVAALPQPIGAVPADAIARRLRQVNPAWPFSEGFASLTFALATGVGKTRLMGAIIAYLFKAGLSRNFLLLAPRDAILRKLEAESHEGHPKYLCVDPGVVSQPRVCTRSNIVDFDPTMKQGMLLPSGPNLFILSPQFLLTEGQIAKHNEFAGTSILDYLRNCGDLVVLIDESHHLNSRELNELARTWGQAVRKLGPKCGFAMTATPPEGASIAYEYGLRQCLQEGLYTKAVRLIVDAKSPRMDDAEYDFYTLDYALSRLDAKAAAISEIRKSHPAFPNIRPVLLVCAEDKAHADSVGDWLQSERQLGPDEVLVIHSGRKTEDELQRLADIERADSKVRVVVQVHVLDEGWDVTNVYVIAPLRNVQSYTNGRQVMGRGLRLPMGYRVEHDEVDTLDVLAFGQETFQVIYNQATAEFGISGTGLTVVAKPANATKVGGTADTAVADDEGDVTCRQEVIALKHKASLLMPCLDLLPVDPTISASVGARLQSAGLTAIDLGSLTTVSTLGRTVLPEEVFIKLVVDITISDCNYLSDCAHSVPLSVAVSAFAKAQGVVKDGMVSADPVFVSKLFIEHFIREVRSHTPRYVPVDNLVETVQLRPYSAYFPDTILEMPDQAKVVWDPSVHPRLAFTGWKRCTHMGAHFDTEPEFRMAQSLDRMAEVRTWLRNSPAQVTIPTLVRAKSGPDFVVWLVSNEVAFLEVKGEHLWEGPESEARVIHRDTVAWVAMANKVIGKPQLRAHLVLGGDVQHVNSWGDVASVDVGAV